MVIMEACAVSPEGIVSPNQARIDSDDLIDGLARIARVIKSQGAIAALQLHHGGRQISAKVIGRKPLAPSPIPCPTIRGDVEPLSIEGIQTLVRRFGEAADRACQAGFELSISFYLPYPISARIDTAAALPVGHASPRNW